MSDRIVGAIAAARRAIETLPATDASHDEMSQRRIDRTKYEKTLPIRENLGQAAAFLQAFSQQNSGDAFIKLPRPLAESIITGLNTLQRIADEIPDKCRPDPNFSPAVVPPGYHRSEATVARQVETVFTDLYAQLAPLRQMPGLRSPKFENSIDLSIAHVLFVDIVGYSKLRNDKQRAAVEQLTQIVRRANEIQTAETRRQVVKISTGDGVALVFFKSPEEPVRCAAEISNALREQCDFLVRMGIHSGPVNAVVDLNDLPNGRRNQRRATGYELW